MNDSFQDFLNDDLFDEEDDVYFDEAHEGRLEVTEESEVAPDFDWDDVGPAEDDLTPEEQANIQRARQMMEGGASFEEAMRAMDKFSCGVIHPVLDEVIDEMGDPADTNVWANDLHPYEEQLRACIADEVLNNLIRGPFNNFGKLAQMSDDEIRLLLMFPITISLIAARKFNERGWNDNPSEPGH